MAKLFNFRCPDDLLEKIEETARSRNLSKSEAATLLIRMGLEALGQGAEMPAMESKTNSKTDKTVENERVLAELEDRLTSKVETSYKEAMRAIALLREELAGELSA